MLGYVTKANLKKRFFKQLK